MPDDHHPGLSSNIVQCPAVAKQRLRAVGLTALVALGCALVGCAEEPVADEQRTPSPSASSPTAETTPSPSPSLHDRAADLVESATVRERVASITMATSPGADADGITQFLTETGVGGFILMGDNIPPDSDALSALTGRISNANPDLRLLIAVDQEGGEVTRIPWDHFPSAMTLKTEDPSATHDAFAARAELLRTAGITINFGIVADYTADPSSFIYGRALGTSAESASSRVAAAVTAESGRVLSTVKHFPGHGATQGDSHLSVPSATMTFDEWSESAALPFSSGIAAGAELLMFGHLAYTEIDERPASLSPEWHRIAREELGFDGVSVTDDLGMLLNSGDPARTDPVENAVVALDAGNDILLWIAGADEGGIIAMIDGVAAAVESGRIPGDRLIEAATRVTELRLAQE